MVFCLLGIGNEFMEYFKNIILMSVFFACPTMTPYILGSLGVIEANNVADYMAVTVLLTVLAMGILTTYGEKHLPFDEEDMQA